MGNKASPPQDSRPRGEISSGLTMFLASAHFDIPVGRLGLSYPTKSASGKGFHLTPIARLSKVTAWKTAPQTRWAIGIRLSLSHSLSLSVADVLMEIVT